LFRRAVGLSPKLHCRVVRFRKALRDASDRTASWAWIALDAGYSDQAHFNRDFLEFTGVTPTTYRNIAPAFPYHVAISPAGHEVKFLQDEQR
jgi:AraC-like DNA-binding protein